jgi:hypothetical protein
VNFHKVSFFLQNILDVFFLLTKVVLCTPLQAVGVGSFSGTTAAASAAASAAAIR